MNSIIIFACLFCLATARVTRKQKEVAKAHTAAPNEFPYHVGLVFSLGYGAKWCGGALIGKEWILTSANCLFHSYQVDLVYGTPNLDKVNYVTVSFTNWHYHPGYDYASRHNDIGLIKVPPVEFTDAIQPIALPKSDISIDGQTVISTGWTYTYKARPVFKNLLYANLNGTSTCSDDQFTSEVTPDKFCASTKAIWESCHGDIGGPSVITSNSSKVLVGVFAFTHPNGCDRNLPIVYTSAAAHLPWIEKTMAEN